MSVRDRIIEADDLKVETVTVPVWGEVDLMQMNGLSFYRLQKRLEELRESGYSDAEKNLRQMAYTLVYSIVENRRHVFADEDVDLLIGKKEDNLITLFNKAMELNGLDSDREEQRKN